MAYLYGSGNETVDRMTNFGITGNVIPHAWYRTIVKDNGRPHLLAIELLADIVYWYRPQEIRDEHTGHLLRYQKKFPATCFRSRTISMLHSSEKRSESSKKPWMCS